MSMHIMSLQHFGVRGMKWGHRKAQDELNSRTRTIKKGTKIQNISSKVLDMSKADRLYTSYTKYERDSYVDLMGNFMYEGRGYKNVFVAKKDLKVASDKQVIESFAKLVRENPKQVAKDMAKAYNAAHIIAYKSIKSFERKLKSLEDPESLKSQKLAKEFLTNTVLDKKAATSVNKFYANLVKEGFDAISDANDRDGGMQDPLIIINMKSINGTSSVKLSKKDLEYYYDYTGTREHMRSRKDLSTIQR